MAGKQTSLITGSNAKIKINGRTLAYATDIQYDLTVATIPVETMGRYEVLANEPIATSVSGSFSVVRYTKTAGTAGSGKISGAAGHGNGVGAWGTRAGTGSAIETVGTGTGNSGMSTHVNPGDILTSTTVDIELFRKTTNEPSGNEESGGVEKFKTIKDARLTRMGGSVNKRGVLMESFAFVAEMIQDDSYESKPSGEEDLSD